MRRMHGFNVSIMMKQMKNSTIDLDQILKEIVRWIFLQQHEFTMTGPEQP